MSLRQGIPLAEGSTGDSVDDVKFRLTELGLDTSLDPASTYGPATRAAVEAFQRRRGLPITGAIDGATWDTLVEAGYRLGRRVLLHQVPMLRGDDVADLQQRLCALGFDTNRVDGLFGGLTAHAVEQFQQNMGLKPDGVAGLLTIEALLRLGPRTENARSVTEVRADETLRRHGGGPLHRSIAIADLGGMAAAVAQLFRELSLSNDVSVIEVTGDEGAQAGQANAAEVDLYLGLHSAGRSTLCRTMFYKGYSYSSSAGQLLATRMSQALPFPFASQSNEVVGMALPLLRETLMTAVIVEVGPAELVAEHGPALCQALVSAILESAREDASEERSSYSTHS
ncbi:MAG: peptidoglycan-binding protein [Actinomycetota bacterium]